MTLSDAELLAIFLRTGVAGKSAVDLERDLITRFVSLNGIFSASVEEICQVHGMGESKFVQLQAIFEMSRRALLEEMQGRDVLTSPHAVRQYLSLKIGALPRALPREVFMGIFLDAQHRVLAIEELFSGTLTQTSVYPREVVKCALRHNASAMIFAHNHPSGVAEPSQADRALTEALKAALNLIDIRVLDHFVVAGNQIVSFSERWLL